MLSSFPPVPPVSTAEDAIIILSLVVGLYLVLGMTSAFAATSITLSPFHEIVKRKWVLSALILQ
jgi:hypothetical protein